MNYVRYLLSKLFSKPPSPQGSSRSLLQPLISDTDDIIRVIPLRSKQFLHGYWLTHNKTLDLGHHSKFYCHPKYKPHMHVFKNGYFKKGLLSYSAKRKRVKKCYNLKKLSLKLDLVRKSETNEWPCYRIKKLDIYFMPPSHLKENIAIPRNIKGINSFHGITSLTLRLEEIMDLSSRLVIKVLSTIRMRRSLLLRSLSLYFVANEATLIDLILQHVEGIVLSQSLMYLKMGFYTIENPNVTRITQIWHNMALTRETLQGLGIVFRPCNHGEN